MEVEQRLIRQAEKTNLWARGEDIKFPVYPFKTEKKYQRNLYKVTICQRCQNEFPMLITKKLKICYACKSKVIRDSKKRLYWENPEKHRQKRKEFRIRKRLLTLSLNSKETENVS